jgi:hypothetical protein
MLLPYMYTNLANISRIWMCTVLVSGEFPLLPPDQRTQLHNIGKVLSSVPKSLILWNPSMGSCLAQLTPTTIEILQTGTTLTPLVLSSIRVLTYDITYSQKVNTRHSHNLSHSLSHSLSHISDKHTLYKCYGNNQGAGKATELDSDNNN